MLKNSNNEFLSLCHSLLRVIISQIYVRIQEDFDNEFVSCTSPVSSEHPALLRLLCIAGFKTCDEQPPPDRPCMLDVLFSNSGPGKE